MAYSKYSSDRSPGREHIPLYPKGFIGIRIVQLIIAILTVGLAAYGGIFYVFNGTILTMAVVCYSPPLAPDLSIQPTLLLLPVSLPDITHK